MDFKTDDLYGAAVLHALGYSLVDVALGAAARREFWFDDKDGQCAGWLCDFRTRKLAPMQPLDFLNSLFAVRAAMYAVPRGGRGSEAD